ncbi:MAG: HNH endonuclease, partial [Lachnospiraceae bacterium]|nr:HNH endonuclease [Lachnospiraceae bacterium]
MSNVTYRFEGDTGIGTLPDGTRFLFDADQFDRIRDTKWYRNYRKPGSRKLYLIDRKGNYLHRVITGCPEGYEVDHISLDTLDNRSCNLRIVTHQQNQINHSLQRNNSSGVSGVDFYPRNEKYRARIKVSQQEI